MTLFLNTGFKNKHTLWNIILLSALKVSMLGVGWITFSRGEGGWKTQLPLIQRDKKLIGLNTRQMIRNY